MHIQGAVQPNGKAVSSFALPHRCSLVVTKQGCTWSFSSKRLIQEFLRQGSFAAQFADKEGLG